MGARASAPATSATDVPATESAARAVRRFHDACTTAAPRAKLSARAEIGTGLVDAAELAVVPGGRRLRHEVKRDALRRLALEHLVRVGADGGVGAPVAH